MCCNCVNSRDMYILSNIARYSDITLPRWTAIDRCRSIDADLSMMTYRHSSPSRQSECSFKTGNITSLRITRTKSLYCRPIPTRNLIRVRDTICRVLTRTYLCFPKKTGRRREARNINDCDRS